MTEQRFSEDLAAKLRSAQLPRAMRGYQEAATRQLLEDAAVSVEGLSAEKGRLEAIVMQLEAAVAAKQAALEEKEEPEETIRRALLAAARSAEELLAEARQEAEDIRLEAKDAADRLLAEGRAEGEQLVARAKAESEAERVRLEEARDQSEQELVSRRAQAEREAAEVSERARRDLGVWRTQVSELLDAATDVHESLLAFSAEAEQAALVARALGNEEQHEQRTDEAEAVAEAEAQTALAGEFPIGSFTSPDSEPGPLV